MKRKIKGHPNSKNTIVTQKRFLEYLKITKCMREFVPDAVTVCFEMVQYLVVDC